MPHFPHHRHLCFCVLDFQTHVGSPLLTKDPATGKFKLTIKAEKSTDLKTFTALPFSSGAATINAQGEMEFQFNSQENAAFFRLGAE